MKRIQIFIFICILIYGCSKDNETTQPESPTINGAWNIQSLAINDTTMNFNDMNDILRKIVINSDKSGELHWYDKLVLDGIEICTWSTSNDSIIFTVSIPNETWTYDFSYLLNNTLTLSGIRNSKNWKYIYKTN